jgi:hypothetical protein
VPFGPYINEYTGKVIDNNDPLKDARIKVSCPEIYGDVTISDWIPSSHTHTGQALIPEIGDLVTITCKDGDPNQLRYKNSHHMENQTPSSCKSEVNLRNKGQSNFDTCGGFTVDEPPSPPRSDYPKIKTIQENSVAFIELDDNGRFQYFNKKTGHFMEFHPDGTFVLKVKKVYIETDNDFSIKSLGRIDLYSIADFTITAFRDLNLWIRNEFLTTVRESISIIARRLFCVGSGSGIDLDTNERINIASRGNITITGKKIDRITMDDVGD